MLLPIASFGIYTPQWPWHLFAADAKQMLQS
jgi:hypothetical protein